MKEVFPVARKRNGDGSKATESPYAPVIAGQFSELQEDLDAVAEETLPRNQPHSRAAPMPVLWVGGSLQSSEARLRLRCRSQAEPPPERPQTA